MSNERSKIILVDDIQSSLDQGRNILRTFYDVYPAPSAARLFELLEKIIPELILLDIAMPEMNGYEVIRKLKGDERYSEIPVIFLTSKDDSDSEIEGFDLGAADYVTKPFSPPLLLKRIEKELLFSKQKHDLISAQVELENHLQSLETLVQQKADTVTRLQNAVFDTVVDMVEFRDLYTGGHIKRTQNFVRILFEEMVREGIYADETADWNKDAILVAAKLHDVGKIAVPDLILGKKGKLTEEEFENMKGHVIASIEAIERILSNAEEEEFFNHSLRMAGTHHEKWDGSGYPMGLKGKNIPLEGRVMAIADVYDALISKRQYKEPFSHETACEMIKEGAGTQFDPVLVEVFTRVEKEFDRIAREIGS